MTRIETRLRVMSWNLWWQFGPWEERLRRDRGDAGGRSTPTCSRCRRCGRTATGTRPPSWRRGSGTSTCTPAGSTSTGSRWGTRCCHAGRSRATSPDAAAGAAGCGRAADRRAGRHRRAAWHGCRSSPPISTGGSTRATSARSRWRPSPSSCTSRRCGPIRRCCAATSTPFPTRTRSACSPAAPAYRCRSSCSTTRGRRRSSGRTDPGFTWSNDNPFAKEDLEPNRRIDYVFVGWPKSEGAGHVLRHEVVATEAVDGCQPSDHYAVMAELRY